MNVDFGLWPFTYVHVEYKEFNSPRGYVAATMCHRQLR